MSDIFSKFRTQLKKGGKTRGRRRRMLATVSTLVIGVLATLYIMSIVVFSKMDKYTNEMMSALNASTDEYDKNLQMDSAYADAMEKMASSLCGYVAYYFHENGFNVLTRNTVTEQLGDYIYIYHYAGDTSDVKDIENGHIVSDKRLAYDLEPDKTLELIRNGTYADGDIHYTSHVVDANRYAIIRWGMDDIFARKSILTAYSADRYQYVFRVNLETGIIEDSSEVETIGRHYEENIEDFGYIDFKGTEYAIAQISGKGPCITTIKEDIPGMMLVSYIPFKDLRYDYLSGIMLPAIFVWVFLLFVLIYFRRFINDSASRDESEIEYVHIYKNLYADGRLISHSLGLVIFATIITVISVLYFQTLLNYSDQDMSASNNLDSFSSFLDSAQENAEIMDTDFLDMQLILCNAISDYFRRFPEKLSSESLKLLNYYMSDVQGILAYDATGTVEYDSGNDKGYTISKNEGATILGEYNLWNLIDGLSDSVGYNDAGSGMYVAAARRQDKKGAIAIRVPYVDVFEVLKLMNPVETLKTADFGYADRILIQEAKPDVMYVASSEGEDIQELPINIPEVIREDGYSGVSRWNGTRYFVNTKKTTNYTMISIVETARLYGAMNTHIYICIILAFALQEIVLIIISMHKKEVAPDNTLNIRNNPFLAETIEYQTMDKKFRGTLRNMTIITALLIIVQIGVDSMGSTTPVIKYLFSSHWPKGLNMFSITMIIIVVTVGLLGGLLLEKLLVFFTKSMGPRGLTIGRMTGSLIRFLDLIIVIALCVRQIGIETSTVLTGAGILGGLTLFCAQTTVNDMLSGFFLVFENQFNIGDWITVGDFRGQVVEIGIRTTRLQIQETYKVYNNSEVRNFKIAEPWDRGAIIEVDIAYKEDATKVIKLLKDSAERYREEIPFIKKGPHIVGVTNLGESGVSIGMRAIADVEKVLTTERELRRVTKQIFDENNIEIPFTQVTLHMGDEMEESVEQKVEMLAGK